MRRVSSRLKWVLVFQLIISMGLGPSFILSSSIAHAAVSPNFVYQGVFTDTGSGLPITNTVDLRLGVYNPAGTCLLYEEEHTSVNLGATNGSFSLKLGSGTQTAASLARGYSMAQVFSNSQVTGACAYTPGAGDGRVLKVEIQNPSGSAYVALSPDQSIESVPTAIIAQTLQGYVPGDFMQSSATNNVTNTNIAANAIDSSKIQDGTVALADLAANAVDSSKIVDGSVAAADIANGAIGLTKLDGDVCANGEVLKKVGGVGGSWACAVDATGGGGGLTSFTEVGTTPLTIGGTLTDPTLTIAQASGVSDGYITAADFLAWNAKVGSVAAGDASVTVGGTATAPTVSVAANGITNAKLADNAVTLSKLDVATCIDGQILKKAGGLWTCGADATGGGGGLSSFTEVGTTPLTIGGTLTDPTLTIAQSSGVSDGYITSANFLAWNAKVGSVTAGDATITVGGSATAPTVALADNAVGLAKINAGVCSDGEILKKAGGVWTCGADATGGSPTLNNGRIWVGAGGVPTELAGGATDDVLKWNGSAWVAGAITGGTMTGATLNNGSVTGTTTVNTSGTITTTNTITGGNIQTGGNITMTGAGSTISNSAGNVQINDNLDVTGNLTVAGGTVTTTANTNLTLSGAGTGTIILNDATAINGNTTVTGTLTATTIGGATVINTTGTITGGAISGSSILSTGDFILGSAISTIYNSADTKVVFGDDIYVNGNGTRGGMLMLNDSDSSAGVSLRSANAVTTAYNLIVPGAPGVAGQTLSVASVAGSDVTLQWAAGGSSATQILGANIDPAAATPSNGQILKWSTGNNRWELASDQVSGGGGIGSLNGLTASSQSMSAGYVASTVAPTWVDNGTDTHTLRYGLASDGAGVTHGLLSNAQYADFLDASSKFNGGTAAAGMFYTGVTAPSNTTRLNYDGYLYATRFYGDGSNLTNIPTGAIANGAITYAKIQNVSTNNRIMGRVTAGAGSMEEMTGTQTTAMLDTFTSALKGLAPASGGGTTNFLRADGTWAAPPTSSGDLTDVTTAATSGLVVTNSAGPAPDIALKNAAALSDQAVMKWDATNDQFVNTALTEATGVLTSSGAAGLTAAAGSNATVTSSGAGSTTVAAGTGGAAITSTGTSATAINLSVTGVNGGITLGANGTGTVRVGGTTPTITSAGALVLQSASGGATTLGSNGGAASTTLRAGTGGLTITNNGNTFTWPTTATGGTTNFLRADGTWSAPAGGGDVTDVTTAADSGLVVTNSAGPAPDIALKNAAALTANTVTKWDDTNNQMTNTVLTESAGMLTSSAAVGLTAAAGSAVTISSSGAGATTLAAGTAGASINSAGTTASAINLNVTGVNGGITLGANGTGTVRVGGTTPTITSAGNLVAQSASGSTSTFGNNAGASLTTIRSGTGFLTLQSASTANNAIELAVSGTNGGISLNPNGTGGVSIGGTSPIVWSASSLTLQNTSGTMVVGSNAGATSTALRSGTGTLTFSNNGWTYTWPNAAPGTPATMFLRGDGTWAAPAGGGDLTDVTTAATSGLVVTNSAGPAPDIALKNAAALTANSVMKWDATNDQFVNTALTEATGVLTSSGAAGLTAAAGSNATLTSSGAGTTTVSGGTGGAAITSTGTSATAINLNVTGVNGGITLGANGTGVVTVAGTTPTVTSAGNMVLGGNTGAATTTIRSGTGGIALTPTTTGVVTVGGTTPTITSAGALVLQSASGGATTLGSNGGAASTVLRAGTGGLSITNNGNTFTWPTTAGTGTTYLRGDGTWATPAGGGGDVTDVTTAATSGLVVTNSAGPAPDIALKNAAALTNNVISKWDGTNDQFVNSGITDTGTALSATRSLALTGTAEFIASAGTVVARNTAAASYGGFRVYNDQNVATRALEIDYSGSTYASSLLTGGPAGESASIATTGAYPLVLGTSNTARLTIAAGGAVSIPGALTVSGTITGNLTGNVTGNVSGSAGSLSGSQANYDVTAGVGNGIRFWNGSNSYRIMMGNSAEFQYGSVTDYSIKTTMDGSPNRGFTWGVNGSAPVAAINANNGNMNIAGSFTPGGAMVYGDMGNSGWGTMIQRGRVFSSNSNIHLSPPGGSNVVINAGYREAGGGAGTTGLEVAGDIFANGNYGMGLVGIYSDTRYQNLFAMGPAYRLSADGTSPGNMYGVAWTHSNIGGQSKAGLGHQMLIMENGVTRTALGTGIWTNNGVTASSYGFHYGVGLSNNGSDSWIRSSGSIWGNGNTLATDGCISAGRGGSCTGAGAIDATNWFRAFGATGIYFSDYAGGWHMTDTTWIRAYNNKSIYTPGTMQAGSFVYDSDRRFKENITPITSALERVTNLKGVHFTWKRNGKPDYGFIAQEVEEFEPDLVTTKETDGNTKGVKYANITAILVEAVKELDQKSDRRLASLEEEAKRKDEEIAKLKADLEVLKSAVQNQK